MASDPSNADTARDGFPPSPLPRGDNELTPSPRTRGEGRGEGSSSSFILHPSSLNSSPHPNPLPEYRERGQDAFNSANGANRNSSAALRQSVDSIAPGNYAIALSAGADSTALLLLLREFRPDIPLHIVHLNHQTRGDESDADESFVRQLAQRFNLPATIARRAEIEPQLSHLPKNKSALFRAMRLRLFADVVQENKLAGVLLAHHADDQAETILHRLLRGSGVRGLRGMAAKSFHQVNRFRLPLYRPLLKISRNQLREYLARHNELWCEDSSNQTDQYFRNRLRRVLSQHSSLNVHLLALGDACTKLMVWTHDHAPHLAESFHTKDLWDLPALLAQTSIREYLKRHGCPPKKITPDAITQLQKMATDAATPARQTFPGNLRLTRRRGVIDIEKNHNS